HGRGQPVSVGTRHHPTWAKGQWVHRGSRALCRRYYQPLIRCAGQRRRGLRMSRRSHHRAAVACARLTGAGYMRCLAWEKQSLISPHQPVPDASTSAQRSLEALMVNVLATALRDRQLGAAFGVVGVIPDPGGLMLRLHPVMADRVLWELLPRYVAAYDEAHGVPGRRVAREAGRMVLHDLLSHARVFVAPSADPRSMMHKLIPPEEPLWL